MSKKSLFGNGGFTLVELIVVIAILAILAGVAVPAYSGYITRANKQTDISLTNDVENALVMAYYNGDLTGGAYIVLSSVEGTAPDFGGNAEVITAMENAFGASWQEAMLLTHDGWIGMTSDQVFAEAYLASSYSGNEDSLVVQLGSLTNTLKNALATAPNLVGNSFNSFLTENKVNAKDNQAVSNAAILYAAETIGELDATKEAAVNAAFQAFFDANSPVVGETDTLMLALKDQLGTYGATAAIYAQGEAFGQYVAANGNPQLLKDFHNIDASGITDTDAALNQVAANLGNMVYAAQTDATINPLAQQYRDNGQYAKDTSAYLETMKKINANAAFFADNLGEAGCYTDGTATGLLEMAIATGSAGIEGCENGEVIIGINADGTTYNSAKFN